MTGAPLISRVELTPVTGALLISRPELTPVTSAPLISRPELTLVASAPLISRPELTLVASALLISRPEGGEPWPAAATATLPWEVPGAVAVADAVCGFTALGSARAARWICGSSPEPARLAARRL